MSTSQNGEALSALKRKTTSARLSRANRIKLVLTTFSLAIVVWSYLAQQGVVNFFMWGNFATAEQALNSGRLAATDMNSPAYTLWLGLVSLVTTLQSNAVAVLPVGVVVVSLSYYVLAKRLFANFVLALGSTIYILTDMMQTGWYNTFAYAWARPLFLLSVLVLVVVLSQARPERYRHSILLVLMFISMIFLHYTPPGWTFIFLVVLLSLVWLTRTRTSGRSEWLFVIILFVLYIGFSRIIYGTFVPELVGTLTEGNALAPVTNLLYQIEAMAFGAADPPGAYEYAGGERGIYGIVRLLVNVLFLVPAALTGPFLLRDALRFRRREFELAELVYVSFLILLVGHAVAYGIVFSFSTQVLIVLGPFLAVLALRYLGASNRICYLYVGLVCLVAVTSLALRLPQYTTFTLRHSTFLPGAEWITTFSPTREINALSSIPTFVFFESANPGVSIAQTHFSETIYHQLVTHDPGFSGVSEYLVSDPLTRTEYATGARITEQYTPLEEYAQEIGSNPNIGRIYDDGHTHTYTIADN